MITFFSYLKGCHMEGGNGIFSVVTEGKVTFNELKLKEANFG